MINGQKVGCGIVTYNRPALLKKLYDSLPAEIIDCVVIINDGEVYPEFSAYDSEVFFNNETNLGVGKSKNRALSRLMDAGCEHLFLIEDDIYIKSPEVFELYILTSTLTGIQHLNYSQHGLMNKTPSGEANAVYRIDYGNGINLPLYRHCVGAFSYYSRRSLEAAGLMDETYHNAFEHVDHTLAIINQNMHPPFWFLPTSIIRSCIWATSPGRSRAQRFRPIPCTAKTPSQPLNTSRSSTAANRSDIRWRLIRN